MNTGQNVARARSLLGAMSPKDLRSIHTSFKGMEIRIEECTNSRIATIKRRTNALLSHLVVGKRDYLLTLDDLHEHSIRQGELYQYLQDDTAFRAMLVEKYLTPQCGGEICSIIGLRICTWTYNDSGTRLIHFDIALGDKSLVEALTDDMFK